VKTYVIEPAASIVVPVGDVNRLAGPDDGPHTVLRTYGVVIWDWEGTTALRCYGPKDALATLKYDLEKIRWRT
jgi:hypothetical protein